MSLMECDDDVCTLPVPLPGAHITARRMAVRLAKLQWTAPIAHVLLVRKWYDEEAGATVVAIQEQLRREMPSVAVSVAADDSGGTDFGPVDLVVCVGGDGTVLHCASLCPGPMPPLISVNSGGSLSFLTSFRCDEVRMAICISHMGRPM